MSNYVERCIELCKQKNPGEVEFHQTVEEVLTSLKPVIDKQMCIRDSSNPLPLKYPLISFLMIPFIHCQHLSLSRSESSDRQDFSITS